MSDRVAGRREQGLQGGPGPRHQAVKEMPLGSSRSVADSKRHCGSWSFKSYLQTSVLLAGKGVRGAGEQEEKAPPCPPLPDFSFPPLEGSEQGMGNRDKE